MKYAWKLFEEVVVNSEVIVPRSLVHAFPLGGRMTRKYELDKYIIKHSFSPGFNFFESYDELVKYLPRFKVRCTWLVACRIRSYGSKKSRSGNYWISPRIFIPSIEWANRIYGSDIMESRKC